MISTIMHYMIFCSSVLISGVGLSRSATETGTSVTKLVKCAIVVFCAVCLSFVITRYLLLSAGLLALMPLVTLLVFIVCSVFVEVLVRITAEISTAEFSVGYLTVLFTLYESRNIIDAMVISFSCVLGYVLSLPLVGAMSRRSNTKERSLCSVLVGLAVVVLSFHAF